MTASAAPARVLVVDDEDNITFLLTTALRHFGFAVDAAGDGRTALQAARAGGHDVIILDVMLPDLDGFEVCRRLRGDGVDTPVLLLTARDGTEDTVRGLTLGGDDYVTKPFSLEEIVARVQAPTAGSWRTTRARWAAPPRRPTRPGWCGVHTPPGTPVAVTVRDGGDAAVVEVADRGPGLDAAAAARVFERFYRADTARTRASGGTGLGLAIVAGIVAAHGGEVAVDTAPGQGARFRLRLPVIPGAAT